MSREFGTGIRQLICRRRFLVRRKPGFCYNSRVNGSPAKQSYSRQGVCRLLGVSERQLRSWQKQELVSGSETFSFTDLIALRTLLGLKKAGIPSFRIRQALSALRTKLRDVADPLKELKIYTDGRKIGVQMAGQKMEPVTGQLLLDFESDYLKKLLSFAEESDRLPAARSRRHKQRLDAEQWFQRGLELEQTGAPIEQAIEAYEQAVSQDPASAGALVNLGTICFRKHAWKDSERYYKLALEADPEYALAHFNLANLFEEKGDSAQALEHYLEAIRLDSDYADAHYNLALLYQGSGQVMKALRHWQCYLKLDPGSAWASIARREMQAIRKTTLVGNGQPE
jgi:tetratricopeptide (TPR) repeat protein